MKKRKRRSLAASRAASSKSWRTRKQMKFARDHVYPTVAKDIVEAFISRHIDDIQSRSRTIDRIPKVEWQ